MDIKTLVLLFCSIIFCSPAASAQKNKAPKKVRVYFLGGQSNMDGHGYVKDLPDSLNKPFKNAYIFHGNTVEDGKSGGGVGTWEKLRPGHGTGFYVDGKGNQHSDRFGVELSFVKELQRLYPNDIIAVIKYSRGGTSIDSLAASWAGSWEPDFNGKGGLNQYDQFLTTVKNAMTHTDIDGDGKPEELVPMGIVWMQGEADASFTEDIANRYYFNLKRLMDLVRAALWTDDLPVVLGKISDSWNDDKDGKVWDHAELVQYAEEKYARTDANAAIVRTTRYYKYSDPWHYDSNGYIDLGKQFADAMYKLDSK